MLRFFIIATIAVAFARAGRTSVQVVVPEQQAEQSGHYVEQSEEYGGEYQGHVSVDEEKESSGAELTSLAHTSAVQAKNAVQSQYTAGTQAAFGIKSTLASAAQGAAQTAQAALVGKQAIVYNIKKQVNEAEKRLQAEIAQYQQTEQAAELAHQVAQQARNQAAAISAALASAQTGGQLASKAASEAANVAAAQQSMVARAKQQLANLIHQLQEAVHELSQTESAYYKATESAQLAQSNAAEAGAAVVAASAKSENSGGEGRHYGHH
ncbi:uncharacterized protein CG45076-like [Anthonomus grandis grandis]|uniref:uncharacterized protein CG45076-like n=1 Tax=Anthonomus grandis grandis TaxID=2921223 RepID=UPI002165EE46|nr:uncharacterized protein CG45076-like [Anthonomus grandis grandis]